MSKYLFTKPGCSACDQLKPIVEEKYDYEIVDISSVDGMALAALYEVLEEPVPFTIIEDEGMVVMQKDLGILFKWFGVDING